MEREVLLVNDNMYRLKRYLGIDEISSLQIWYHGEIRLASLIKKRV